MIIDLNEGPKGFFDFIIFDFNLIGAFGKKHMHHFFLLKENFTRTEIFFGELRRFLKNLCQELGIHTMNKIYRGLGLPEPFFAIFSSI